MPRTFHAAFPFQAWLPGLACLALAATGTGNALAAPNTPIQSQVAEGLKLAAAAKVGIADYFANWGTVPYTRSDAGLTPNPTDTQGAYVTAVDINGGLISITYGNLANPAIAGQTLTLAPLRSADGHLSWQCGLAPMPAGLTPLNGTASTTLPNQYLPAPCGLYNKPPIKSQVDEGLRLAESAKLAVLESFFSNNVLPNNRAEAGLSPNPGDTQGNYVSSVDIANGQIIVTYGNLASAAIAGQVLTLAPLRSPDGYAISWQCGLAPRPAGLTPLGGTAWTSLPNEYLPAPCGLYNKPPIKSQVSEGLGLAESAKIAVQEFFASNNALPSNRTQVGLSPNPSDTQGNYVSAIDIADGRVIVTYGNLASAEIAGTQFVFTPKQWADGSLRWSCGGGTLPARYIPSGCNSETTPPNKQINEGLHLAADLKRQVGIYIATHAGMPPQDRSSIGLSSNPADTSGNFVSSVDISNGSIVIMYGNLARAELSGQSLALSPYRSADGHITWVCGNAQIPPGLAPIGGMGPTTLGNELLPAQCRF